MLSDHLLLPPMPRPHDAAFEQRECGLSRVGRLLLDCRVPL